METDDEMKTKAEQDVKRGQEYVSYYLVKTVLFFLFSGAFRLIWNDAVAPAFSVKPISYELSVSLMCLAAVMGFAFRYFAVNK